MYACIYYLPPSWIHTLCQLSSTASAMHQSLHMLVLYIFTCWMHSRSVYSSLTISKMKVTLIKRLTVLWLELHVCGTFLLKCPSCRDSTIGLLEARRWLTMQTVHTEDCANLELLNHTLYVGKDLIGWSWKNVNGPASHLLLFIVCHNKQSCLYTFEQKVNHLSYLPHNTQRSLTHNCQAKKCQIPKQLSFLTIP